MHDIRWTVDTSQKLPKSNEKIHFDGFTSTIRDTNECRFILMTPNKLVNLKSLGSGDRIKNR